MEDCIFCQIVKGAKPANVLYSDDVAMAFLDIHPVNPGHLLVIPKKHASYLSELDEETGGHLFEIGMRLASALRRSGLKCEGINLHLADGEAAFQEILHVHLHVIPRFTGDGFRIVFGRTYGTLPTQQELDVAAAKIKKALS